MVRILAPLAILLLAAIAAPVPVGALGTDHPAATWWAQAGVQGGIPLVLPVVAQVTPDDDLQAAIDAAPAEGGVIALAAGQYRIAKTLTLRSGLVLRGAGPKATTLNLTMTSDRPVRLGDAPTHWTAGILLRGVERAGLADLTIVYDDSLPPPVDPRNTPQALADNPHQRSDLHVISVLLHGARDCWIINCTLQNAGTHPLVAARSRHITLEGLEILGAHNRGPGSGSFALVSSEQVMISALRVQDINGVVFQSNADDASCRGNVVTTSSFETDVRLHGTGTTHNLFERCIITVPAWLAQPPFSPGNAAAREPPPGPGNLLHLCTVTRHFASGGRTFSMADDPGKIYQIIETYARDGASSVVVIGDAPASASLIPSP